LCELYSEQIAMKKNILQEDTSFSSDFLF